MRTVALHTILKPGHEADYDRLHQTIPHDVASALRDHGVHEWRIWRDGRHVFHLVEVDDYQAMRAALRTLPANVQWQATIGPLFDVPDDYGGADPVVALLWSLTEQPDR
jgi:L-rhamnose mutarotase